MVLLGGVTVWTGAIVFAINLETQWVPRSVPAGAVIGALVIAAWGRATWRRLKERDESVDREGATKVLVIGAGEGGRELVGSMLRDPPRVASGGPARRRPEQEAPPHPRRPGHRVDRPARASTRRPPASRRS